MDFYALIVFAFVASITPGPNNLMLAASGMQFGFIKTVPHALGIELGMTVIFIMCGYGIGQTVLTSPNARWLLSFAASLYLLYLLWNILHLQNAISESKIASKPMTCWQAASFQFINPKAWLVGITATALFISDTHWYNIASFVVTFMVVAMGSISAWTLFGRFLQSIYNNSRYRRSVQASLVLLTMYTVASLWIW
ncbi:LysE family translocator [Aurantivibrio plasticivorans]